MSFILDALKKIEQDKRRSDGTPMESVAVSRSRFGRRRPLLAMIGVALGSALLTAAAVSWLSLDREAGPIADAVTSPASTDPSPDPGAEPAVAAPVAPVVAGESRSRAAEVEPVEAPRRASRPAPEPAAAPEGERAPLSAPASTVEDLPAQPIRIVGRERALLNGLSIGDAGERADPEDVGTADDELPEDFPDLVLQGTSMIGNDAVAVISDQRVFEGDRVEGALVVRIGEREVELELDGRRFTLRL